MFYDGHCPICRRWVGRMHTALVCRGLHPVPLQAAWARRRLGLGDGDPLVEMKLLMDGGVIYGGADALLEIARAIWWAWPLFAIAQFPGVKQLMRGIYSRLAANRPCDDGRCGVPKREAQKRRGISSAVFELP